LDRKFTPTKRNQRRSFPLVADNQKFESKNTTLSTKIEKMRVCGRSLQKTMIIGYPAWFFQDYLG